MARSPGKAIRGIGEVFYETRVLMGREFTVRRFAGEVLGGSVDPVMLGYVEKGKRFPSEALVRRLAAVRGDDAHELLALLWRDRMLHAFAKELGRALAAPRGPVGIDDAELAVLVSQAIAALPDDGAWSTLAAWRKALRAAPRRRAARVAREGPSAALLERVEQALRERGLVEVRAGRVRRRGRHFVAADAAERQSLAIELCALFAKSLLDKLVLAERDTGTYLRNHYLHIEPERLPEFREKLDAALRGLAEAFACDPSSHSRFLNVLATATTL